MSKMVRISESSYEKLKKLEKAIGISKQSILEQALEKVAREQIFKQVSKSYEAIYAGPEAKKEFEEELAAWDTTLEDGLDDEW